jgi:DNA-binding transcriptional ArsR family regulator
MDNHQPALNDVFRALADPTRRAVLRQLTRGPASVTELAEPFGMALPSFMKHIAVLEGSELISTRKTGRIRTCRLKPTKLARAERWLADQRAIWEGRTDRLADYAETLAAKEQRK